MINFDDVSYKMIVNVFNAVIDDFCPDNVHAFKTNEAQSIIYTIVDGKRYRVKKYCRECKNGIRFSIVPKDHCRDIVGIVYDVVEDENNFVKSKQNPPVVHPTEFINEIISKLGIEKLVYEKLMELKDARTLILML